MIGFVEYEACLEAWRGGDASSQNSRRLALALFTIRHMILTYRNLDSQQHGFFTVDDMLGMQDVNDCIYDYISVPAARLYRVFQHVVTNLHSSILRENILMPIYKANEFNGRSIAWLSRRPGRTVREKLSGTKSVMAVRRRLSIDTAENRLFKAAVKRMYLLLHKKTECLPKGKVPREEAELLLLCHNFLHSEEAEEIGVWTNPPPNNTLLSDRYYHEVWNTWNELKAMNALLQDDQRKMPQILANLAALELVRIAGRVCRFPQEAIFYDEGLGGAFETWDCDSQGMQWRLVGIENHRRVEIKWGDTDNVTVSCGKETRLFCFRNLSMKEDNKEIIPRARFNWNLVKKRLENSLRSLLGKKVIAQSCGQDKAVAEHEGDHAVIDIFSVRPRVVIDEKSSLLEERLIGIQGEARKDLKEIEFTAGRSRMLRSGHGINRLNTVLGLVESAQPNDKVHLQKHMQALRRYIKTDELTLIYPDSYNEFQLQPVRQMAKMYYFRARALPKSLDIVFHMLNMPEYQGILSDKIVLIFVDQVSNDVSMTIVMPVLDKKLARSVAKSRGLIWEHHPSTILDMEPFRIQLSPSEEKALNFLGRDVILAEGGSLSFLTEDGEEVDLLELRGKLRKKTQDLTKHLDSFINGNIKLIGKRRLYLVCLTDRLLFNARALGCEVVDFQVDNVGKGVFFYDALADMAGDTPLWREYLPDISIKRMIGFFDLVKDNTFDYGAVREKEISLPNIRFTLPQGQKEYHFQLHLSNASTKTVYEAVVRNRAFPLDHDVECELRMTYIYNADNPYALVFRSLERGKTSFNEARVEWEPLTKYPVSGLPYQAFPAEETWDSLARFPDKNEPGAVIDILSELHEALKRVIYPESILIHEFSENRYKNRANFKVTFMDGSQGSLMLVNAEKMFQSLEQNDKLEEFNRLMHEQHDLQIVAYIDVRAREENSGRMTENLEGETWNSRGFILRECNIAGTKYPITFSVDNLRFTSDKNRRLGRMSFYVNNNNIEQYGENPNRRIFARDIVFSSENAYVTHGLYLAGSVYEAYLARFSEKLISEYKGNWLLFLLHTAYGSGRSFSDAIASFRDATEILQQIRQSVEIFLSVRADNSTEAIRIKETLLHIIALTNKDAGDSFYESLYDELQFYLDSGKFIPYWIGFALGGCETPGEQWLFDYLANAQREKFIYTLSLAVWRNGRFLMNAPHDILMKFFDIALDTFVENYKYVKKHSADMFDNSQENARLLEFILSMFRLRELKDDEINRKLSLNNLKLMRLYHCLEEMVTKKQFQNFQTRIRLLVTKSPEYAKYEIPDLIYALMVCITGTDADNTIVISAIEENEL